MSNGVNRKGSNNTTTVRFDLVAKPPSTPRIEEAEDEAEVEVVGRPDSANSMYSDDFDVEEDVASPAELNGTFHYVHGQSTEESTSNNVQNVVLALDDDDEDEIPEEIH